MGLLQVSCESPTSGVGTSLPGGSVCISGMQQMASQDETEQNMTRKEGQKWFDLLLYLWFMQHKHWAVLQNKNVYFTCFRLPKINVFQKWNISKNTIHCLAMSYLWIKFFLIHFLSWRQMLVCLLRFRVINPHNAEHENTSPELKHGGGGNILRPCFSSAGKWKWAKSNNRML